MSAIWQAGVKVTPSGAVTWANWAHSLNLCAFLCRSDRSNLCWWLSGLYFLVFYLMCSMFYCIVIINLCFMVFNCFVSHSLTNSAPQHWTVLYVHLQGTHIPACSSDLMTPLFPFDSLSFLLFPKVYINSVGLYCLVFCLSVHCASIRHQLPATFTGCKHLGKAFHLVNVARGPRGSG